MNSELKEKLENFQQKLDELKEERSSLIQKFNDGEKLSRKERKRNIWLATEIKNIESHIQALESIYKYNGVKNDLECFINCETSLTKDQKKALIARITSPLLEMSEVMTADIETIENISELESKKQELENKIKADMKTMANHNTSKVKKQEIAVKYISLIDAYINPLIDEYLYENNENLDNIIDYDVDSDLDNDNNENIDNIMDYEISDFDNDDNKKSFKEKTKDKLNTIGDTLNKHKKKIIAIAGSAVLIIGIIIVAKSINKNIETTNKEDNNPTPTSTVQTNENDNHLTIEQIYENANKETIDSLVKKGYDEYSAMFMVENFSKNTIDSLLKVPYVEAIKKYVTVKDFNLDYINDYENAFITYSIVPEKAVDYVNRSYEISKTNFYEDVSINEIVEIVMALDKKELFTKNNVNLAQSFNTSFNQITEKYLFGELEEADINKLNALKYFAKEGSDMDDFLTNYSLLVQEVLKYPSKEGPRNKMYDFISIFAHTLNGYKNEVELTDSDALNENAIVKDYYNWYMAYCSFIAPLYPTFNNPNVEVHGYIDENGVEVFESSDERYMKYLELQELIISNMQSPEIQAMCGQSQNLN